MGPRAVARALAMGGMAAVSAVLAHGGAAGLKNEAWIAAATAGSLLVAVALTIAAHHAAMLQCRRDRIAAGDVRSCIVDPDPAAALSVLVAAALVCQGGAHVGLLGVGVHASDAVATPTLHVLLGFLSAVAVYGLDRLLSQMGAAIADAVGALLELLLDAVIAPDPAPPRVPRSQIALHGLHSRAPPIAA